MQGSAVPRAEKGLSAADADSRLGQLTDMGYPGKEARAAVCATRGGSIEEALDWIEAKKVEAELDVGR